MWFKKKGVPEEEELVLCTVSKILPHSVFVKLDEYGSVEGLIHISEIAPGRVKNIRDFVKEGKKVVCKVLRSDSRAGQADLSLRRVNLGQRKEKLEAVQFEDRAEKVLESVAKRLKISLEEVYKKVGFELIEKYGSLSNAFELLVDEKSDWKEVKGDPKLKADLIATVKEKIKPPEVSVTGTLTLSSQDPKGIDLIKSVFKKADESAKKSKFKVQFSYLSAPKYRIVMYGRDFKSAEKQLSEVVELILKEMKGKGVAEFSK